MNSTIDLRHISFVSPTSNIKHASITTPKLENPSIPPLHVITLSTDDNNAIKNWKYGATKLGYSYTVLGIGEKWGGWSWRTRKYLDKVLSLPKGTIVVLVDGNDILFARPPEDLYRVWKSFGEPVVFGGEPTCCTGEFAMSLLNGKRDYAKAIIESRNPPTRWKFPNAGCIVGYRERIIQLLEDVLDEKDDQAGYLSHYLKDPNYLAIDYYQRLVGNINAFTFRYCIDCTILDNKEEYEAQFWEYGTHKDMPIYKNKQTNAIPCILHFPGKNITLYNRFGAKLYGKHFRPIEHPQNQSKMNNALVGVLLTLR